MDKIITARVSSCLSRGRRRCHEARNTPGRCTPWSSVAEPALEMARPGHNTFCPGCAVGSTGTDWRQRGGTRRSNWLLPSGSHTIPSSSMADTGLWPGLRICACGVRRLMPHPGAKNSATSSRAPSICRSRPSSVALKPRATSSHPAGVRTDAATPDGEAASLSVFIGRQGNRGDAANRTRQTLAQQRMDFGACAALVRKRLATAREFTSHFPTPNSERTSGRELVRTIGSRHPLLRGLRRASTRQNSVLSRPTTGMGARA